MMIYFKEITKVWEQDDFNTYPADLHRVMCDSGSEVHEAPGFE